jgi:hypothetical protein
MYVWFLTTAFKKHQNVISQKDPDLSAIFPDNE